MAGLCEGGNEPPGSLKASDFGVLQATVTSRYWSDSNQRHYEELATSFGTTTTDRVKSTVTGMIYLDMLQNWLMRQLNEDSNDYISQEDGSPCHYHNTVREYLKVFHTGRKDDALMKWPPRSSDLTPCDFFLWGFVKDIAAVALVNRDKLEYVWGEMDYAWMYAVLAKVETLSICEPLSTVLRYNPHSVSYSILISHNKAAQRPGLSHDRFAIIVMVELLR
ncbi:hypothetical protein ANN_11057 [Periplaneta americana]|uniref:Uncharacterized protein n=1 Tax=Periplaneta americana TaxID=6978 RepID=A0ABQ8T3Y0_PERAM|nr:hypothetical protein ANN_11057 [Periplaneta americana]